MIREKMREVVFDAWDHIPGTHTVRERFTFKKRWWWAERKSNNPIYCLADDDCLPQPELSLPRIEELFLLHPEYGVLALADVYGQYPKGQDIIESTNVGGIRFIRKGIVTGFPPTFKGCDGEYYDLMTKAGYKSGIVTEYTRLHMGVYHSLWQGRNDAGD